MSFLTKYPPLFSSLQVVLDGSLQGRRVGTDHLGNLLPVLEQQESRHGADAQLLGDVRHGVDVDLDERRVGVGLAELLDLGGDGFARTAPGREGVEDDELVTGDGGLEFGFAGTCQFAVMEIGRMCSSLVQLLDTHCDSSRLESERSSGGEVSRRRPCDHTRRSDGRRRDNAAKRGHGGCEGRRGTIEAD